MACDSEIKIIFYVSLSHTSLIIIGTEWEVLLGLFKVSVPVLSTADSRGNVLAPSCHSEIIYLLCVSVDHP